MRNSKRIVLTFGLLMAFGASVLGCSKEDAESKTEENQPIQNSVQETDKKETLKSFEAETLDGNSYTQADLAKKDVTVFNFWALTCGPCIAEMPDIAEFAKSLPDNVQVITVCLDGGYDKESAKSILTEAGYEGVTLLSGNGDFQKLCYEIQYTPTTIVVDQNGNMIGDAIIGGQNDLAGVYTDAINNALRSMGKAEIGDADN